MPFEQRRPGFLVPVPWPGQFARVQYLAKVVRCRTEEHCVAVEGQVREVPPDGLDQIGRRVMDERQVGD